MLDKASKEGGTKNMDDVEVNTIDQYQGRDKEMIVVSFVKNKHKSEQVKNLLLYTNYITTVKISKMSVFCTFFFLASTSIDL